jgi:translation initiation factor IF-2
VITSSSSKTRSAACGAKDDVSEVQQGYECGLTIERFNDYKVSDVVEAYVTEKVAATEL